MPAFCTILALFGTIAGPLAIPMPVSPSMPVLPRLRPADLTAAHAFERGLACCPTIRALVREVEFSDLIVYVEAGFVEPPAVAQTVLMGAGTSTRYVRVTLHRTMPLDSLIELLGHELQHTVEIARAPEVRDRDSMLALYRRIGFRRSPANHFETSLARQIGVRVRAEIGKRPSLAGFSAAPDADTGRRTR